MLTVPPPPSFNPFSTLYLPSRMTKPLWTVLSELPFPSPFFPFIVIMDLLSCATMLHPSANTDTHNILPRPARKLIIIPFRPEPYVLIIHDHPPLPANLTLHILVMPTLTTGFPCVPYNYSHNCSQNNITGCPFAAHPKHVRTTCVLEPLQCMINRFSACNDQP
ncbi:uncharacterized protein EI90DRAFT_3030726 [Cantharellus anzutake]|uniref:uncharacterized protein n=1 Tax=Cantharellus anzutake TaxID=1750568 RepID=UPI001905C053|nr:uncharacterized protein EI90DRAFT_3030726 [Cantharellus anzutake]KAF8342929.1 hypothetical protein EI90DRAFT_3030726 [Cantharellus anzutake]